MSEDNSGNKNGKSKPAITREGMRRRNLLLGTTSLVAASAVMSTTLPRAANAATSEIFPTPKPPFKGKIERTLKGWFPNFRKA